VNGPSLGGLHERESFASSVRTEKCDQPGGHLRRRICPKLPSMVKSRHSQPRSDRLRLSQPPRLPGGGSVAQPL
jgi:hypothetical protein